MPDSSHPITPEGRAQAEAELEHLRGTRRREIVAAIKTAREFGDLKENAEYHAAREAQGMNESRIRVLEHHLATATDPGGDPAPSEVAGAVAVGSRVTYRDESSGEVREVTLVHPLESSLAEGRVSVESPIGRALLEARAGESVTLETPRGAKRLAILDVR